MIELIACLQTYPDAAVALRRRLRCVRDADDIAIWLDDRVDQHPVVDGGDQSLYSVVVIDRFPEFAFPTQVMWLPSLV